MGVRNNALIPIVLQGARADEKVFANLSPSKADFSPEEWTVRLGNLPNTLAYFLNEGVPKCKYQFDNLTV